MASVLVCGHTVVCVLISVVLAVFLLWIVSRLFSRRGGGGTAVQKGYRYGVLITGCDSGFGHRLARRLDAEGLAVFAGCLFPEGAGARSLAESCSPHLRVLHLDVTRDEHVQRAKEAVRADLPENGLWAVVNNAGISDWAETEWNTVDDYRRMVDVNLFGCIRTSLAFLPMVRAAKGRMVYVSSIMAFYNCLNMGAYSVSKRGLEAFADCLRVEMDSFGVKVCIVQPGNFAGATNIARPKTGQDIWDGLDDERRRTFSRRYVDRAAEGAAAACRGGCADSSAVVEAMLDAVASVRPKSRYLVVPGGAGGTALFLRLVPYLPTRLADAMLARSPMNAARKAMLYSD